MSKKILFILNYATKQIRFYEINSFAKAPYLAAKSVGYEFHMNTNSDEVIQKNLDSEIHYHTIGIYRNPLSKDTWVAYKQLLKLLRENKFDVIHCNTPIGGVLGRLCGKKADVKKVIYQVHGFHFYKGAPLVNRVLYYAIERYMAHYTDALITINKEDYQAAQKFKLRNGGKVYYVPGVGIDVDLYKDVLCDKNELRQEIRLRQSDFVLLSAGRLDKNKNNAVIIKALAHLNYSDIHFVLCGEGEEADNLKELVRKYGLEQQVHFLGNRTDMNNIYKVSDVFMMMSYREGLSRSIMEAMASGLPCIVSRIRGNVDLIDEAKGGYLCAPNDDRALAQNIEDLYTNRQMCLQMGSYNLNRVRRYDLKQIVARLEKIYREIDNEAGEGMNGKTK